MEVRELLDSYEYPGDDTPDRQGQRAEGTASGPDAWFEIGEETITN